MKTNCEPLSTEMDGYVFFFFFSHCWLQPTSLATFHMKDSASILQDKSLRNWQRPNSRRAFLVKNAQNEQHGSNTKRLTAALVFRVWQPTNKIHGSHHHMDTNRHPLWRRSGFLALLGSVLKLKDLKAVSCQCLLRYGMGNSTSNIFIPLNSFPLVLQAVEGTKRGGGR
jgi:hypothetical protein